MSVRDTQHTIFDAQRGTPASDMGAAAWEDVLQAVDRTYAELVDYQEQLESRNAELTELRHFLRSIMESMSDYLVVLGRDGLIEQASTAFSTLTGWHPDALQRTPLTDFVGPDDRPALSDILSKVLSERRAATLEVSLLGRDEPEPVEFRIAPRLDRRRKSVGTVLTGRPLGELRRAYSELEQSHVALKDAQTHLVRNEKLASLGRLLAGVAHELNNPISFVYANTHALEKYITRFENYFDRVQAGASREELIELRERLKLSRELRNLRTAIEGAKDGSERVRDIVEDLRRLSAEGVGEMSRFDLVEAARIAASWVQRGGKSRTVVRFEGAERCDVTGRPGHIQQVLLNLIQNAMDATADLDQPEICVTVTCDGPKAVLAVRDNGPGIPSEIAATVFDPFFTTKPVGKGTGLGLSISHKIAEEHGGSLQLCEDVDSGACFRLVMNREEME